MLPLVYSSAHNTVSTSYYEYDCEAVIVERIRCIKASIIWNTYTTGICIHTLLQIPQGYTPTVTIEYSEDC